MHAELTDNTWTVVDPNGGRWWPNEDAQREIAEASDPAAKAVEICSQTPMRGTWKQ